MYEFLVSEFDGSAKKSIKPIKTNLPKYKDEEEYRSLLKMTKMASSENIPEQMITNMAAFTNLPPSDQMLSAMDYPTNIPSKTRFRTPENDYDDELKRIEQLSLQSRI